MCAESLYLGKHLWFYHHDQDNRHVQHLPEFPGIPVRVCMCVLRILSMRFTFLANFEMYNTILLAVGTMSYSWSLEIIVAICNNMCEPEGHYDKWNKPNTEEQTCDSVTSKSHSWLFHDISFSLALSWEKREWTKAQGREGTIFFFFNPPFLKVAKRVKLQSSHHKEKKFVAMCGDGCRFIVVIISQYI